MITGELLKNLPEAPTGFIHRPRRAVGGGGPVSVDNGGPDDDIEDEEVEVVQVNKRKRVTVAKKKTIAEENIDYLLNILEVGRRNGMTKEIFYSQIVDINLDSIMVSQMMDKLAKKLDTKATIQDEEFLKLKKIQSVYDDVAELEDIKYDHTSPRWPVVVSYFTQALFNCESISTIDSIIGDLEFMVKVAKFQRKHALENRESLEILRKFLKRYHLSKFQDISADMMENFVGMGFFALPEI